MKMIKYLLYFHILYYNNIAITPFLLKSGTHCYKNNKQIHINLFIIFIFIYNFFHVFYVFLFFHVFHILLLTLIHNHIVHNSV
jgi:hypothetical protein